MMLKLILPVSVLTLPLVFSYYERKPLFLTPLIKAGKISEAQKAANVKPFLIGVISYSGYLTVDEDLKSHMFFWFFPKTSNWNSAPLVTWSEGGPGGSPLHNVFAKHGPYVYRIGYRFSRGEYSWTNHFNVLYIDNPVGTGFSFTETDQGYATNQTRIGQDLHEVLRQFLLLFPPLQKNQIILGGNSYAGKYLSALASTVLDKSKKTKPEISVYGIFMSSPFISAEHMLGKYHEYLYWHGLLDETGKEILQKREKEIATLISAKKWAEASELFAETFLFGYRSERNLLYQLTGLRNHINLQKDLIERDEYVEFLKSDTAKAALHVGQNDFAKNARTVFARLKSDLMKSTKPDFERALENYKVMTLSGQMDIICPFHTNENLFRNLTWSRSSDYHNARRQLLKFEETLVGYSKKAGHFVHVLVRNAGHGLSSDQPQWVLGVLKKFASGGFENSSGSIDISF